MKQIIFCLTVITTLFSCCKTPLENPQQHVSKPFIRFLAPEERKHFLPGDTMHLVWTSEGLGDKKISIVAGHNDPASTGGVVAWGLGNDLPNNGAIDILIPGDANMRNEWLGHIMVDTFFSYRTFFIDNEIGAYLDQATPQSAAIHSGTQSHVLSINLVGTSRIDMLRFQRIGVSANNMVTGVYLYDGITNQRLTDAGVLSSDGTVMFTNLNLTVQGIRTIKIVIDLVPGISGCSIGMSLIGYRVKASSSSQVVALSGNLMVVTL